jgi:hypothetical protein
MNSMLQELKDLRFRLQATSVKGLSAYEKAERQRLLDRLDAAILEFAVH